MASRGCDSNSEQEAQGRVSGLRESTGESTLSEGRKPLQVSAAGHAGRITRQLGREAAEQARVQAAQSSQLCIRTPRGHV